jgi:hypothetical protein
MSSKPPPLAKHSGLDAALPESQASIRVLMGPLP